MSTQPVKPSYDVALEEVPLIASALSKMLDKCSFVLNQLNQDQYVACCGYKTNFEKNQSPVGEHMRHVLEYIAIAIQGNETGVVNYDLRERDHKIQTDLEYAKQTVLELKQKAFFITHADLSKPIDHFEAVDPDIEDEEPSPSSLKRELSHVIQHAEHHLYIMRVQCDTLGIRMPSDLGVAAATLQHEKNNPS